MSRSDSAFLRCVRLLILVIGERHARKQRRGIRQHAPRESPRWGTSTDTSAAPETLTRDASLLGVSEGENLTCDKMQRYP
jgi:hypothetical protein